MTLFVNAKLSKSFGSRVLFQDFALSLFHKEKVGLIGPNGAGKSTILKILAKLENPDAGEVVLKKGLTLGYVPQTCFFDERNPMDILLGELDSFSGSDVEKKHMAEMWLSKVGFEEIPLNAALLSGGWKKRLAIASAMVRCPDVLLLDEPTNHLDLEGIRWLENFLATEVTTYLLTSHDRHFLKTSVNRVVEINRSYPDGFFSISGNYSYFLEKKTEFLDGQLQQERSLASKARRQNEWLHQNAKARTTKAEARIDHAEAVLKNLEEVQKRNRQQKAQIAFVSSQRETRKLLVAKNLSKKMGERTLFQNIDFTLSPGTRLGLLGPNGSGKTTLLRLIAEELSPDLGTIKKADGVKIVYFDQHRVQLSDEMSLRQALSPNGDFVRFRGKAIHVHGWCKRFLFTPDLLDMPIGKLSGGEKARISLAHLMLQPADILLLDEPANDLDIATLEAFEDNLAEFPGSIVLITHDREMLTKMCNAFLLLGNPESCEVYADFGHWETSFQKPKKSSKEKIEKQSIPSQKLSFKEKKEYESLEDNLRKLELKVHQLNEKIGLETSPETMQDLCKQLHVTEEEIHTLYLRWEELDRKST